VIIEFKLREGGQSVLFSVQ